MTGLVFIYLGERDGGNRGGEDDERGLNWDVCKIDFSSLMLIPNGLEFGGMEKRSSWRLC